MDDVTRVCIYTTDKEEGEIEHSVVKIPTDIFEEISSCSVWTEKGEDFIFVHLGPLTVQIFKES